MVTRIFIEHFDSSATNAGRRFISTSQRNGEGADDFCNDLYIQSTEYIAVRDGVSAKA